VTRSIIMVINIGDLPLATKLMGFIVLQDIMESSGELNGRSMN
jgi:hypothetical protein